MKTRTLALEDLEDMVIGATILSTGGGGSPGNAQKTARQLIRRGFKPKIVDPKELKRNTLVFSPGDVGGGLSSEEEERFKQVYKTEIPIKWKKWPLEKWSPASVKELEKYLRRKAEVYLSTELGPGAFMGVIEQAAKDGKATIDGDTVGRAVPEMTMSKLHINHAKILASVSTSHFGDVIILKHAADLRRMEDIARAFSTASGGGVGMAIAMDGLTTKKSLIPHTISRCIDLGRKIRESERDDNNLLERVTKETGGRVLFQGRITNVENESKHGHLLGSYSFEGTGEYSGHTFKIWFKNENHISWKDGEVLATSPDIITVFDPATRCGLWNWDMVPKDHDLYVIGIPCDKRWRTKEGLVVLGPRAFGFDLEYTPIEALA